MSEKKQKDKKRPRISPFRTPKREYTIADLMAICEQMNGRIRFEIVPIETFGFPAPVADQEPKR